MGAYQIWHIEFRNKEDRDKFEKITKFKRLFQYKHEYKDEGYDCTYYVGWQGYNTGREFLEANHKLRLIKFESLDLSTQGAWYDEKKSKSSSSF